MYDRGGMPSATSMVRMTRQWPGNATGWFVEVLFVGLLADSLPPTVHDTSMNTAMSV